MRKSETLRRRLKSGMALKNYGLEETAVRMRMSVHQLRRRLANPERISFEELEKFEKVLGIKILA